MRARYPVSPGTYQRVALLALGALTLIVNQFGGFTGYTTTINRLGSLLEWLQGCTTDCATPGARISVSEGKDIIMDKMTGRSKGFGFVEMSSDEEAQAAIDMWNGKELDGRPIVVSEARPREERPRSSSNDRGGNRY